MSYFIPELTVMHPEQPPDIIPTKLVPLLGKITAGEPGFAVQEKSGDIRVSKYLDAEFGLIVKGDSMLGAGINPGDIAICKKARFADHGDIVAALVNGGDTTLKYLLQEGDTWLLRAANPKYSDIILRPDDDRIQGIVVKVESDPVSYKKALELEKPESDWAEVGKEAAKYGISPEAAKRLIKSFGRLKDGLPDEEE